MLTSIRKPFCCPKKEGEAHGRLFYLKCTYRRNKYLHSFFLVETGHKYREFYIVHLRLPFLAVIFLLECPAVQYQNAAISASTDAAWARYVKKS